MTINSTIKTRDYCIITTAPTCFHLAQPSWWGTYNTHSHWRYLQDSISPSWRNEDSIPIQNFTIMALFTAKRIPVPL